MWKEAISQKCDIFCAQETHLSADSPPRISHINFPHCFFANTEKKARGVLIAIKNSITFTQKFVVTDPNGRFIILGAP